MYPQARCVHVPTRDPTSHADFEQVDQLWTHVTTTNKYLQILTYEDGCHSCELQSTLRQALSCFMYPQGRCVYVPTRDPTSRADFEQGDQLWTHVTTTNKYLQILTYEDGCHSCELQSTLRQALSCFMYPQGRCVYVPTRDPTSRADFEQVDELWNHMTTTKMDVILVSCKIH